MALALGIPVGEMLDRMTSRELTEWMAFWNISPWGEERQDLRAGTVASPLLNALVRKRISKPSDWVTDTGERQQQDPETIGTLLRGLAAATGKVVGPDGDAG